MPPPVTCPYTEDDLLNYCLGEAAPDGLPGHLGQCPHCRDRLTVLEGESLTLRDAAPAAGAQPADPAADMPGKVGKFLVVGRLGGDPTGTAFRAVHPGLGMQVALKLSARQPPGDNCRERLIDVARRLCGLAHPNLAQVVDLDFDDGVPFLVSHFTKGRPLDRVRSEEGLAPRQSAQIVAKIARALAAAHRCGADHQDVRPANVVVDDAGEPLLTGLGPDGFRDAWGDAPPARDARGDVAALGAVLYFLLTGQEPADWYGLTAAGLDAAALHDRQIPRKLRAVCEQALAVRPEARYASADELAVDLEKCSKASGWGWGLFS